MPFLALKGIQVSANYQVYTDECYWSIIVLQYRQPLLALASLGSETLIGLVSAKVAKASTVVSVKGYCHQ